ncbi:MAG: dephospho-CoA kinase [Desulfosalsimonadaceae bacterium]|nr:dephospho-CoA kinase [Desulfosalsimonadaceae bacterium]
MKISDFDNHGKPLVRLGITGGVGSGKTVVCDYLKRLGVTVVSTDQLARSAVMPGMSAFDKIVHSFGHDILSEDGTLNRKKLRNLITEDKEKKATLEQFVHPEVLAQITEAYAAARKRRESLIVVEVPLLFETGMASLFDYVLTVTVRADVRMQRIMERDHVSREEALALMGIQMPEEEKIRRSDFVVENNGSLEDTRMRVDAFYKQLRSLMERRQADKK